MVMAAATMWAPLSEAPRHAARDAPGLRTLCCTCTSGWAAVNRKSSQLRGCLIVQVRKGC